MAGVLDRFAVPARPAEGELTWRDIPSSMSGAGWGTGKASWLGGMGAIGGALGFDTEDYVRRKAEEAAFYSQNAPGTTHFFGEGGVTDGGSLGDWLAFNFGQSAPYILEAMGGAGLGSLALKSARGAALAKAAAENFGEGAVRSQASRAIGSELARTGATTIPAAFERQALEEALQGVSSRYAMGAGMAASTYPSAVGDILENQREAGGEYELGAALAGAVPYTALNFLGGEAAVGRALTGGLTRGGTNTAAGGIGDYLAATLKGNTLPGALVRGGAKAGFWEGIGETGQETINQGFGQMVADPSKSFTDPDFLARAAESFASGFGLGAIPGAGATVFAKPMSESPDAIAMRASTLDRSLEQVLAGNETWRETLERGRAEEDAYTAEREADDKARADGQYEQDFQALVAEEDAKARLATTLEKLKQQKLKTQLETSKFARDLLDTATEEEPQTDWVQAATGDGALIGSSLYDEAAPTPPTPAQRVVLLEHAIQRLNNMGVRGGLMIQAQTALKKARAEATPVQLPQEVMDAGTLFDATLQPRPPLELTNEIYPIEPSAPATPEQQAVVGRLAELNRGRALPGRDTHLAMQQVSRNENDAWDLAQLADATEPMPLFKLADDMRNRAEAERIENARRAKLEEQRAAKETREALIDSEINSLDTYNEYAVPNINASLRKQGLPTLTTEESDRVKRGSRLVNRMGDEIVPEREATKGRQYGGTELFSLERQDVMPEAVDVDAERAAYRKTFDDYRRALSVRDTALASQIADEAATRFTDYGNQFEAELQAEAATNPERTAQLDLFAEAQKKRGFRKPKGPINDQPSQDSTATKAAQPAATEEATPADATVAPSESQAPTQKAPLTAKQKWQQAVDSKLATQEKAAIARRWNNDFSLQADGTTFKFSQLSPEAQQEWQQAVDSKLATQEKADELVAKSAQKVEAPVVEAPVVEAPAVEAPVVEAPVVEVQDENTVPEYLYDVVRVEYDNGQGKQVVSASAAVEDLTTRINNLNEFIKCLGG